MRLNEYLQQSPSITEFNKTRDELFELIDTKVDRSFLIAIKSAKEFIYRGSYSTIPFYDIKSSHDIRNTAMPKQSKDAINQHLKKKFGWSVRDGIFTSSNRSHVQNYFGSANIFFPLNDYKYVWSNKVGDINLVPDFQKFTGEVFDIRRDDQDLKRDKSKEDMEKLTNKIGEWFHREYLNSYKNNNLVQAIESGNEIAFHCREYILVNELYKDVLKERYL